MRAAGRQTAAGSGLWGKLGRLPPLTPGPLILTQWGGGQIWTDQGQVQPVLWSVGFLERWFLLILSLATPKPLSLSSLESTGLFDLSLRISGHPQDQYSHREPGRNTHKLPGTVLGTWDRAVIRTDKLSPARFLCFR